MDDDGNPITDKTVEEYVAVVVGDTVGDPLKDTNGPALNILMKLMVIIALVLRLFSWLLSTLPAHIKIHKEQWKSFQIM